MAAIITGASSGIGRELAIKFSSAGHVILSGRSERRLEETRMKCADFHGSTVVCGDLREQYARNVLIADANYNRLRYLVLCAGVYNVFNPLKLDEIKDTIYSNLLINQILISSLYPNMLSGSAIIHINSVAGRNLSGPEEAVYSASKHGMAAFLRSLRPEARLKGIRVLDVFLGAMQTPMMRDRADYTSLIDPKEAAETIFSSVSEIKSTMQVDEMVISRSRFK